MSIFIVVVAINLAFIAAFAIIEGQPADKNAAVSMSEAK